MGGVAVWSSIGYWSVSVSDWSGYWSSYWGSQISGVGNSQDGSKKNSLQKREHCLFYIHQRKTVEQNFLVLSGKSQRSSPFIGTQNTI